MANNVQKTITFDGPVADLAVIYRWAQNIVDNWVTIKDHMAIHRDLSYLVDLLGGDAHQLADIHGWSDIETVDFDGDQLYIEVITPYGNLKDMLAWFRKRFPKCDIRCWIDAEFPTENEVD